MTLVSEASSLKFDPDREEVAEQRTGVERRHFSYTAYIPERRSGRDRRKDEAPLQTIYDPLVE